MFTPILTAPCGLCAAGSAARVDAGGRVCPGCLLRRDHADVADVAGAAQGLAPLPAARPGDAADGSAPIRLADGTHALLRPLGRADAGRLRRLFGRLSPTTILRCFLVPLREP